jgi:Concanavalin A-like lectin/glucanases superfamily
MRIVWIAAFLLAISASAFAQPSGQYLRLQGFPQHGYIEIPHDLLLDTPAMTVEAWVSVRDPRSGGCSSIVGKGYQTAWWVGICGTTLRSYFNGAPSIRDGGVMPTVPTVWIHIATVTDGTTRKHYINGDLVAQGAETARSFSTLPVRIGSDPNYAFSPEGGIDDLRIWKVARTQDQIRQTMYSPFILEANDVTGQFQGLEAWYRFEGDAMDSWRTHHGTIMGTGIGFAAAPPFRRHAAGH